jgi:hypothetical protein
MVLLEFELPRTYLHELIEIVAITILVAGPLLFWWVFARRAVKRKALGLTEAPAEERAQANAAPREKSF